MSWKSSYRGSITNKKNIYGVMGGLAKGRMSGASGNRATNKLVIPRGAAKGFAYMQMHGILSRNPQSGGVGKVVKIASHVSNVSNGLGETSLGEPKVGTDADPPLYSLFRQAGCSDAGGQYPDWPGATEDFSVVADFCIANNCAAIEGLLTGEEYLGKYLYTPYSSIGSLAMNQTNKQCIVAPLPGIRFPRNVNKECPTSRVGSCTSCKYPAVILGQSDLDNSGSLMNY